MNVQGSLPVAEAIPFANVEENRISPLVQRVQRICGAVIFIPPAVCSGGFLYNNSVLGLAYAGVGIVTDNLLDIPHDFIKGQLHSMNLSYRTETLAKIALKLTKMTGNIVLSQLFLSKVCDFDVSCVGVLSMMGLSTVITAVQMVAMSLLLSQARQN